MTRPVVCPDCSGHGFYTPPMGRRVVGVCRMCDGTGTCPPCPIEGGPWACAWDANLQQFIPECGCPVHDPDERKRST